METISYPIGIGKYSPLLPSHRSTFRIISPQKPIFFPRPQRFSSVRFKAVPFSDLRCSAAASDHHHDEDVHRHKHQNHSHDRDHQHQHNHNCCGNRNGEESELTEIQKAIVRFAKAVRWTELADFLRENLHLCSASAVLFLAAAACPYLVPMPVVRPMQSAFMIIGFPLVGVSALLDALIDIGGGKVNIHVLMALSAFASALMGNALEGGLLLAMFNLSHIAEEYFTSRSMIDVKELKENHPEFSLVLDIDQNYVPNTYDLAYKRVPVHKLEVGSYILVGAGESVPVDCEVFQGNATITIEHLTGEVKPLEIKVGDRIPGGARNVDGRMIVKATKTWTDSTLSRIVQLTEEAHLNKPKLQRWLDQFGEQYSKIVVVLSAAIAVLGPFLFKWPFFSTAGGT